MKHLQLAMISIICTSPFILSGCLTKPPKVEEGAKLKRESDASNAAPVIGGKRDFEQAKPQDVFTKKTKPLFSSGDALPDSFLNEKVKYTMGPINASALDSEPNITKTKKFLYDKKVLISGSVVQLGGKLTTQKGNTQILSLFTSNSSIAPQKYRTRKELIDFSFDMQAILKFNEFGDAQNISEQYQKIPKYATENETVLIRPAATSPDGAYRPAAYSSRAIRRLVGYGYYKK